MKFILPLPPTLNHTYKMGKGRYYKDPIAAEWEKHAGWIVGHNHPTLEGDLSTTIHIFYKYNRDIDSSLKLVLDLLATMKVYKNDNQIVELIVKKFKDVEHPRLVVDI